MQCRAIARRCPLGSVTVLGDLAQATTPWAPGDWALTLSHLGHAARDRPAADRRLPRARARCSTLANRLLPHIAVDVPPATSVRAGHDALQLSPARRRWSTRSRGCLAVEGSVGVIVPDAESTERAGRARTRLGGRHARRRGRRRRHGRARRPRPRVWSSTRWCRSNRPPSSPPNRRGRPVCGGSTSC